MTAIIIISKEKPYLVRIISEDLEETFQVENLYIQAESVIPEKRTRLF